MTLVLLSLAGGLGAVARFVLDAVLARRTASSRWPVGTATINISGSFLLGLLTALALGHTDGVSLEARNVLGTGFCGGYTTFSTASLEALRLSLAHERGSAVAYLLVSLLGSVLAAALGLWVGGAK